MNYLIIGDGAAGTTAAQTIRKHDPHGTITIISDDPNAAYYRAALTNYLIGELNEAQLWAVPPSFYRDLRITRRFGRAAAINTVSQTVTLNDGTAVPYDKLLIATGSRAKRPPFAGAEMNGVMVMRTLQDVQRVMNLVTQKQLKRAVIIGGGPLAMEWVVGLHRRGVAVSYLLRRDHLMRRTLDRTASDLTLSRMKLEGIDVRVNTEIEAVIGRNDQAQAVRLQKTGEQIPCQLVGVAIGVQCNTEWLRDSAVPLHEKTAAVVANERLETGVLNVWAAGDVAQVGAHLLQLWEPARLQGRIAGANMVGRAEAYRPGAHYNATRLYDLDFASVGDLSGGDGVETAVDFPREGKKITYKKLFVRNGQVVGAILLGDVSENVRKRGRQFKRLIDSGLDVSGLNGSLLDPHFDVRSWMQGQLSDIDVKRVRRVPVERTGADLRQTQALPKKIINKQQSITDEQVEMAAVQLIVNGKRVDLVKSVQVGRSSDNDVVVDDAAVSHVHAQLTEQGGAWYVRDVGSSNGTFVNGERVMTPHLLSFGDEILMGETKMQFVAVGQSPLSPPLNPPQREGDKSPALRESRQKPCVHCGEMVKVSAQFCPHCGQTMVAAPPVTGLTLQVITRKQQGRQVVVVDHAWIGRDFNCALVLTDRTISGRHLEVIKRDDTYFVRDWASLNGSQLNGRPLTAEFEPIASGDTIRLGETLRLRVV